MFFQPLTYQKEVLTVPVLINGQREEAQLESDCFKSVVCSDIVSRDLWTEASANICCVHGVEKVCPIAEVYLTVDGQTYLMPVALVSKLPYSVNLGSDVPFLFDLIQEVQTKTQLNKDSVGSPVQGTEI